MQGKILRLLKIKYLTWCDFLRYYVYFCLHSRSIPQVAPNITAFGVPPTYLPQLTQVYSPRPGAVYVPAAATYDASARFDGHAMNVVPVSVTFSVFNVSQTTDD